jgi:uncharacterized membrane protein YoaK (UPF0700 family)
LLEEEMYIWKLGKPLTLAHTEAMPTATPGNGITLPDLLGALHERGRIALLILLLTLTAAWIDMLSYLSLGRVFASFMTGNILFIGLGVAQGNSGLLLRALVAVLVFLVAVACGSFCLGRVPQQQTETAWRNTFVRYLLMEWLLLLVYAIIWRVTGNLSQQAAVQILLLCIAALGMGIQGALVMAFNIPGVVADALTGTVILLGQRFAQGLEHPGPQSREWRWNSLFLALLCLVYVASALVVALTSAFMLTPVVPVIVVTIAILALLFPSRQATSSFPTPSS